MIVVVGIVAILSIAVGDSVLMFFKAEESAANQSSSIIMAQGAFDAMVRDVRAANYGADGSYPIASMSADSLTFFSPTGANGPVQRLTFQVSGTSLLESITRPSGNPPAYPAAPSASDIADSVQNLTRNVALFRYFDSAGNEITDFSRTAAVASVLVTLQVNSTINPLSTYTLQSSVTLRNLRSD
jgi:type II secretory pathway pseudopilin PulG